MSLPRLTRQFCCHIVAIFFLFGSPVSAQTTINVPADQPTIQAAINAANNGDTVLVAPGTYVENLNFNGKAITVTSSGGPLVTIVDGNAVAPVVMFITNEGPGATLSGFTLRNGVPSASFPYWGAGAGIAIYYASPTITNNVITGNHGVCGVGIEVQGGSALIRGNTITGNVQAGGTGGCGGGGIEVAGDSLHPPATPSIIGNTITNNSLDGGGNGGGISATYFSSPTIRSNYIAGNSVFNNGGGINLWTYNAPVVAQNIIVNNRAGAGGSGGGISVQGPAGATYAIVSNTIVGNTAFDGSSGIYAYVIFPAVISNNIVVAAPGQNAIVCDPWSSSFPTFSHNDVVAPSGQAWSSNCAGFAQSNGNISADPLFVNSASGDYRLQAGSPAIDAGDNAAANLPQQDYAGNIRVLDGNNDCVATVDLGVYELPNLAGPANVTFSPGSLSFPSQPIGTSSFPQSATLTNTGAGCFQFSGPQITGDFSQTNSCSSVGLLSGSSCVYSVTFSPTASGVRTGALTVSGSDGISKSAPSVSLNGTGLTPAAVSLSPASINFGYLPLGSYSAQTVTLTNTGQASLSIYSVSASSPFTATNYCSALLPGGGSCSISVAFTPSATGSKSGLLSIVDNAGGSPHTVSLSGAGTDFSVSASPASGTVRAGQSIQFTINVAPVAGPYNPGVALSCSGPAYAPCTFSPASVIPGASGANSVLTISTNKKLSRGTYTIGVIGQSGSLQHSSTISLTVK
jgi:hypothetical protein